MKKRIVLACALLLAIGTLASVGEAEARNRHREREQYRAENWWRYNEAPPPHLAHRGSWRRPCGYRGYRHDNGYHRGWDGYRSRRWRDRW